VFLAALASLGPLAARALGAAVPAWAPLALALLGLAAGLARALTLRPDDAAAAAALDRATGGTGRFQTLNELPAAHPFRAAIERDAAAALPRAADVAPVRLLPSATALVLAWAGNAALLAIPARAADPAAADGAVVEALPDARPGPGARPADRMAAAARGVEVARAKAALAGESQAALERLARALETTPELRHLAEALRRRDPGALREAAASSRATAAPGSGTGAGTAPGGAVPAALREAASDPQLARSARELLLDAAAAAGRGEGNAWLAPLERLIEDARGGAGGAALTRAEAAARRLPPAPPAPVDPRSRAREAALFESEAPPGFRDVARRYFLAVLARR